ncbi:hypothetical protein DFH09DRAFT_1479103 [Mycena vulgaris]|nr:hypothetical protein DFH09DRAFT_1479103 [Mycena vulgaris]
MSLALLKKGLTAYKEQVKKRKDDLTQLLKKEEKKNMVDMEEMLEEQTENKRVEETARLPRNVQDLQPCLWCNCARGLFERLFKDAEGDLDSRGRSAWEGGADPQLDVDLKIAGPPLSPTPAATAPPLSEAPPTPGPALRTLSDTELAQQFTAAMRDYEFSPAELQGYLFSNRERPIAAAAKMGGWVVRQRAKRQENEERKTERKERMRMQRAKMEAARFQQQFGAYPFPPPPLGSSSVVDITHTPVGSTPPVPAFVAPSGDADVVAVPPAANSPAAATTAAPASPPCVSPATPGMDLEDPESPEPPDVLAVLPQPTLVNALNRTF